MGGVQGGYHQGWGGFYGWCLCTWLCFVEACLRAVCGCGEMYTYGGYCLWSPSVGLQALSFVLAAACHDAASTLYPVPTNCCRWRTCSAFLMPFGCKLPNWPPETLDGGREKTGFFPALWPAFSEPTSALSTRAVAPHPRRLVGQVLWQGSTARAPEPTREGMGPGMPPPGLRDMLQSHPWAQGGLRHTTRLGGTRTP